MDVSNLDLPAFVALACVRAGWGIDSLDLVTALAVSHAESGWNETATHKNSDGSTDYGLFQLNGKYHPTTTAEKYHAFPNAAKAHAIWRQGGWGQWTTFKNKTHLKPEHNNAANAAIAAYHKRFDDNPALADLVAANKIASTANSAGSSPIASLVAGATSGAAGVASSLGGVAGLVQKVTSDLLTVLVALACIIVGIVILSRNSGVGRVVASGAKMAVTKGVLK